MQTYRESPMVPVVETTFQAPHRISYDIIGGVAIALGIPTFVALGSSLLSWIVAPAMLVFGVLFIAVGLRVRKTRVTVSSSGLRITGAQAIELPWSEIDEARLERTAVGYARTVFVRVVVGSDGQRFTLPTWLDADFDAAFDLQLGAARLPLMREKLERGQVVPFGALTVTPDSLRGPEHDITFDRVAFAKIRLDDQVPILEIRSDQGIWPAIPLTDVPNYAVLVAFLQNLKSAP